ncbi:MAG: lipoprotein [Peptococcales bacterium]
MRKMLIIFIVFFLVLSLAGCGVKEKIESKVSEKIVEKTLETVVGDGDTKIDIDGGKITVKDKDGGEATFGGTEWPKNGISDYIPEFKAGKISGVIQNADSSALIMVEEVKKKDFESYYEKIKKDFTENVFEMNSDDAITFFGENGKDFAVQLTYEVENEILTIGGSKTNG